jgi:hypothetical protein
MRNAGKEAVSKGGFASPRWGRQDKKDTLTGEVEAMVFVYRLILCAILRLSWKRV